MPRIPQYRRKRVPSAEIGAAPLPVSAADIAGGTIGRGISALGKGVGDVGEFIHKVNIIKQQERDTADYWKGLGEYQSANNQYFKDLREGNVRDVNGVAITPDKYVDSYDAVTSQQANILSNKSRKAQARLKNYFAFHDPINRAKIDSMAFKLRQSEDLAALDTTIDVKLEAAANADTPLEGKAFLDEIDTMIDESTPRLIMPATAKELKDNVKKRFDIAVHNAAVNKVHAAIGSKDFELAESLTKSDVIPHKERTTLRNAIESAESSTENKSITLQQTAIDLTYENVAENLSKDLNSVDLNNLKDVLPALPENDSAIIESVFNHRASELNKGNVDPFTIEDDAVYATFLRTIELDAKAVDPKKMFGFIGKGLTPDNFNSLNDFRTFALRKDNPLQQPFVKDAFALLNDFYKLTDDVITPEELVIQHREQNNTKRLIMDFVNSGIEGDELNRKIEESVAPVSEKMIGNWLTSWWRGHMPYYLGGHAGWISDWRAPAGTKFFKPENELVFERFVNTIRIEHSEEEARAYYELWKGDFE